MIFYDGHIVDNSKYGRKQHLLHLMLTAERTYTIENTTINVQGQNVLFIPSNTAYSTQAHSVNGSPCTGIGVSFDTTKKDGTPLLLPQGVYYKACGNKTKELFFEIDKVYKEIPIKHTKLKSLILELISHLAKEKNNEAYQMISPALDLMSITFRENIPIRVYAQKCYLSESYFRKNFKAVTGLSPIDYRNELRFAEAERLYLSGESVGQIAKAVGFCDEVFFLKLYKKRFASSIKNRLKTV